MTDPEPIRSGATVIVRLAIAAFLALTFAALSFAERLPMRRYTSADGLAHDRVSRIFPDSRGFLWFCTLDGLSRFDGVRFVNYPVHEGMVTAVAEGPGGVYWVGIWRGGLGRLDPQARDASEAIEPVPGDYPRSVRHLLFGGSGRLWMATAVGLFAVDGLKGDPEFQAIELAGGRGPARPNIWELAEDRQGVLWIATDDGELLRRSPTGEVTSQQLVPGHEFIRTISVLEDREGRIWAGHELGVTIFDPQSPGDGRWLGPEVVGEGTVLDVFQTSDGTIWLSHQKGGLTRFDGERFATIEASDGGTTSLPMRLAEDPSGNLWIGTYDGGVLRMAPTGFTAYDEADGLTQSRRASILEDRDGNVLVAHGGTLYLFDGGRFEAIRPASLEGLDSGSTSDNVVVLHDRQDGWWLGARHGLFRYAPQPVTGLSQSVPTGVHTAESGLPGRRVMALFEDVGGDVWIGTAGPPGVARFDVASGTLHRFPTDAGLPTGTPVSFAQDNDGNIWVAFSSGTVARYRSGRFTAFGERDGFVKSTAIFEMRVDRDNRLWIGTQGAGVVVVDEPSAPRPTFRTVPGSGPRVRVTVEDRWGRVYLGTHAGVLRLEADGVPIRHFTTADGLSNNEIWGAMRDSSGALWFTSNRGVSRLVPRAQPRQAPSPPPVWVSGLRIAGRSHPVALIGETDVSGIRIPPHQDQVEIDFGGTGFELGQTLRYQYRLEGTEAVWSAPSTDRRVHYAGLSPGRYRFLVRAVDAHGSASVQPATVAFVVLSPVWQRWWFLSAAGALLGLAVYAAHRYRLARILELERVRTRIATDLHDDIGSSLSQIAVLSEVVQRQVDRKDPGVTGPLERIAGTSRELVDSMSDIVWAINPRRDNLRDVVHRMRRFASDTLAPRDIELHFNAPDDDGRLRLGPELRRELFLVFKESLHNVIKHARCTRVDVEIGIEDSRLELIVRDDGGGFETTVRSDGHGLSSMTRRAGRMRGSLHVESRPGAGTTLRLQVPLGRGRALPG